MDVSACKERISKFVVEPMLQMIHEFEMDSYTDEDVAEVQSILNAYVETLAALRDPSDAEIMAQVQSVVLRLNELNEAKDYFIETEEREWLWEVIQKSAEDCGLQNVPDDVTEEWREW